ncbi:SSI family serine proteinase inhibitor [Streptomyces megasporus]|uniref:SSI family serine proteinase inhibitor n=1 Tax=Streptomyces megasporus TaxID=44060 RepID=UPI0004E1D339|nr:SSI family serine proteinase inhibitor [Streptomyces megasporus]
MLRRTAAVLAGAAVLAAVAAPAAARPWPWPRPIVPPAHQDQLTITVTGDGAAVEGTERAPRTYTLECHPAGGSHPDPLAACGAIDRAAKGAGDPWAPVPEGSMCAQVYGGSAVARVTGTWRGAPVDASFDRTDGCEIARWDALVPALPHPGT